MSEKPFVTQADWNEHVRSDWRVAHGIWANVRESGEWGYTIAQIDAFFEGESGGKKQVDWARITSKPAAFTPIPHTHLKADITDTPWAWAEVSKTGSNLTDLDTRQHAGLSDAPADAHHPQAHTLTQHSTKAHSELSDAPANAHHPQSHTLASHSTKAHAELSDAPANAHHAQLHASAHEVDGGDLVDHDYLSGFVAAEHLSLPNTMANVLSSYLLDDLSNTDISFPADASLLQYWTSDSKWHDVVDLPPSAHAATHHVAGSDLVYHDSLTGFVAAEHKSLPNTITEVLSDHTKAVHDALNIDAKYIDGKEVVATTPTDGHVLTYVSANTRWEDKAIGSTIALADLSDVDIGAPESGELLEYSEVDSKWHNVTAPPPTAHAASHHSGGADQVNHDSLLGFVAGEHKSLPNTLAQVLSDHNLAAHTALGLFDQHSDVDHNQTTNYAANQHVVLPNSMANVINAGHTAALHNTLGLDHGSLVGKADDDHTQYYNAARHTVAVHNALAIAHSSLSGVSSDQHHLEDHTLLSHTTRPHSALTDVSSDQHHPQSHTLTSHSTKAHSELSDAPANAHHAQVHAASHHVAGGDLVNHDSLTGFVAAEHLSLPNTIANVLSNHTKAVHDILDISAAEIDGVEVVAPTPTDGHVLMYVLANTRWENKPIGASVALGDLSDVTLGALENADLLQYWTSDSKWHNVADIPPIDHATSHHVAGGDLVNHDSLTGFLAAEHKSLPNTIAQVLSDHTKAAHDALLITVLGSEALAKDHGTAATDMLVNVCYGTGNPPTANLTTIGTLFVKYTA